MFSNLESTHMCRCCLYPPTTILGIFAILRSFLIILSKTYLQKHKSKTFKMNQALKFRKSVKKWLWENLICAAVTMYLHTYSVIPIIITGSILSTGLKGEEFFYFLHRFGEFFPPIFIGKANFLYFLHWQVKFFKILR